MKITCQACQSKYTIADDKVLGKVVKIRCKKCGATIFVNGDGSTSTGSDADHEPLSRYRADSPVEGWTVNVAEGDQRTMTDEQVVAAFRAGTIDGETFLWKEGMPDWVPLREAGEVFVACTAKAAASTATAKVGAAQASTDPMAAPAVNAWQDGGAPGVSNGSGGAFPAAAARRAGGRAAGVDLFGAVAQAGGEADVITSAPAKMPQVHEGPQKATGARNESSVLFSLSAMTSKSSSDPPPRVHGEEASGLIDIRQLSAQIGIEDKKQSRVDDIMNLTGGGAFSPTLMAPTLSAPAFDAYAPDSVAGGGLAPQGRNKGVILLAFGAGACVLVAAIGGAYLWMHGRMSTDSDTAASSASSTEVAAAPSAAVTTAPPTPSIPSATAAAAEAPSAASPPEASAKSGSPETKTAANGPATKEPASAPAPRAAAAQPVEAGPFNMGEARARLGAAAAAAAGCKKANGPTGTGRVVVLFAPSGGTQSAAVSGPPFEGTPTGACVAARFRSVRVPAFSGSPFSVSKSFSIN